MKKEKNPINVRECSLVFAKLSNLKAHKGLHAGFIFKVFIPLKENLELVSLTKTIQFQEFLKN